MTGSRRSTSARLILRSMTRLAIRRRRALWMSRRTTGSATASRPAGPPHRCGTTQQARPVLLRRDHSRSSRRRRLRSRRRLRPSLPRCQHRSRPRVRRMQLPRLRCGSRIWARWTGRTGLRPRVRLRMVRRRLRPSVRLRLRCPFRRMRIRLRVRGRGRLRVGRCLRLRRVRTWERTSGLGCGRLFRRRLWGRGPRFRRVGSGLGMPVGEGRRRVMLGRGLRLRSMRLSRRLRVR